MTDSGPYVTKTGRVLTAADIEALADEAEQGYDVSHLKGKDNRAYVVTRPAHRRDPNNIHATLCGHTVAGRADYNQVLQQPHLRCQRCTRKES